MDQYLSEILSAPVASQPLGKGELVGVPLYLVQRYRLSRASILGRSVVFAEPVPGEGLGPTTVLKDLRQLEDHLGAPAVIVRERLPSWERGRYVAAGLPFIVPGEQLFLPMMLIDLREVKRRPALVAKQTEHLTWAAQVVLLRHLLFGDVSGVSLQDLAQRLGYSRMTLTKVQRELESHGLCRVESVGRAKVLAFESDSAVLWNSVLVVARSPVRERRLLARCEAELPAAGLSALAASSIIADESRPVVAAAISRAKEFIERKSLLVTPDPDAAIGVLEVWNYDPMCLAHERMVDPLSLYLSLREDSDERVQAALAATMEALPWSMA